MGYARHVGRIGALAVAEDNSGAAVAEDDAHAHATVLGSGSANVAQALRESRATAASVGMNNLVKSQALNGGHSPGLIFGNDGTAEASADGDHARAVVFGDGKTVSVP